MMLRSVFVLALWFCFTQSAFPPLTRRKLCEIKEKLVELIEGSTSPQGPTFKTFIPSFVRLAFHDCVGFCDGCINFDIQDNAGLEVGVIPLQRLYDNEGYREILSVADLWALAGITAVEMAARNAGGEVHLPFRWGRKDCSTPPFTKRPNVLPNADLGWQGTRQFFTEEFGFKPREMVAALGAHTLGKASMANSGFTGAWVPKQDQLTNRYYVDMLNVTLQWHQIDVNANYSRRKPKWQWERPGIPRPFMMMNSDMSISRKISLDSSGFCTNCDVVFDCPKQTETIAYVKEYAEDFEKWLKDFQRVFIKIIEHVKYDLQEPLEDDEDSTAKFGVDGHQNSIASQLEKESLPLRYSSLFNVIDKARKKGLSQPSTRQDIHGKL